MNTSALPRSGSFTMRTNGTARSANCRWRDRVGKKPLYYGWSNGCLLFGSELKALRAHPRFDHRIDLDALGQYVRFGWVPEPLSIYASLRKLPPGSLVRIPVDSTPCLSSPKFTGTQPGFARKRGTMYLPAVMNRRSGNWTDCLTGR